jgi:hypothetical protein
MHTYDITTLVQVLRSVYGEDETIAICERMIASPRGIPVVRTAFGVLIEELDGDLSNAADEIRDIVDLHAKRHGTGVIM